jgi:glycogen operon protein
MLLAGDEMGRTQGGNNNAYCQDTEIGWVDWSRLGEDEKLVDLIARLSLIRAAHPVLRQDAYVHGEGLGPLTGLRDIDWLRPDGRRMTQDDWHEPAAHCLGILLSAPVPGTPPGEDVLLMLFNAGEHAVRFKLPQDARFAALFRGWRCILATAEAPEPDDTAVTVPERCVCVFEPVMARTLT